MSPNLVLIISRLIENIGIAKRGGGGIIQSWSFMVIGHSWSDARFHNHHRLCQINVNLEKKEKVNFIHFKLIGV